MSKRRSKWKFEERKLIVIRVPDDVNIEVIERLMSNIHTNDKGCWIKGSDSTIYTTIKYEGKIQRAHRVAFEVFTGKKIPYNLNGCHTCDIPACINPAHIFIGDNQANNQDAIKKGRVKEFRIDKRKKTKEEKWAEFPKLRMLLKGY